MDTFWNTADLSGQYVRRHLGPEDVDHLDGG